MDDTLDKLTNLLTVLKGATSGVSSDGEGGRHVSLLGTLGGMGQAMQANKNLAFERKAAEQQLEIQKWQFEQEKENRKAQKELRDMELSQARTTHAANQANAQEKFREFNQSQMREVLRGERSPEDVQFVGDRFKPSKDASGRLTPKMDESFAMLEKVRAGGLQSVVKNEAFEKETEFQKPTPKNLGKMAGPIGAVSGFIFNAFNPMTKQYEPKTARVIPDVDGSVLTAGLSLSSLEDLRDLSIAKPEYFDQRSKDKIAQALIERKQTDINISNRNKQLNAEAIQLGLVNEEDVISDARLNNTIAPYVPADLSIAKLKIKESLLEAVKNPTNPQSFRNVFQGINELMVGSAKNAFRQTEDWTSEQKLDIQQAKQQTPLPGMSNPQSVILQKNSVKDRLKYRTKQNAKPTR